jgi:hypothetical protein
MYKFIYKGEEYTFNPEFEVPFYDLETETMTFGPQTLKEQLGMTDEESAAAHAEGLLNELRGERDKKLKETDTWGLQDYPATDEQLAYRQALRDITNTYSSLQDVVWPDKP